MNQKSDDLDAKRGAKSDASKSRKNEHSASKKLVFGLNTNITR
jgi:hypothetical protein